jgi:hypothetical protein
MQPSTNGTREEADCGELVRIVTVAQGLMRERLAALERAGGLTLERYGRYLSMQYHLTKGVQRCFFAVAAHPDLRSMKALRQFLVRFAIEEEPHFQLAEKDLRNLGITEIPLPFDVELWHAYFRSTLEERPFLRLGATCVLENIAGRSQDLIDSLFRGAPYLDKRNTVFVSIHRHGEELPHGDQILEAVRSARLLPHHVADLVEGAVKGATMYLRLVDWALTDSPRDLGLGGRVGR